MTTLLQTYTRGYQHSRDRNAKSSDEVNYPWVLMVSQTL